MRLRVRLHADLSPLQRDAHRNALLTLPSAYEIVETGEDFVVTRPGERPGSAVHVVAGVPLDSDGPDALAATVVDWDPVVEEFVTWISAHLSSLVAIHISVWTTEEESEHLEEGRRLAGRLVPDVATSSWRETRVGSTVIASCSSEVARVAVSAGRGIAGQPRLEARAIGHGFTAALTVSTGLDARRSDAVMTTPEGSVGPSRPYSSAFRRLWLKLADDRSS